MYSCVLSTALGTGFIAVNKGPTLRPWKCKSIYEGAVGDRNKGKDAVERWWGLGATLQGGQYGPFFDNVIFEQRPEVSEGANYVDIWGKLVWQRREHSKGECAYRVPRITKRSCSHSRADKEGSKMRPQWSPGPRPSGHCRDFDLSESGRHQSALSRGKTWSDFSFSTTSLAAVFGTDWRGRSRSGSRPEAIAVI